MNITVLKQENEKAKACGLSFEQAAILAERAYGTEFGKADYTAFAEDPIPYKKGHTEFSVFKLKNSKKVVIAFQGSNGFLDWVDDLCCIMINHKEEHQDYEGVLISAGFSSNYNPIDNIIRKLVGAYGPENVIFIGHSLGAANAVRARFEIFTNFNVTVPTIVFGEPNGGNKNYYAMVGTKNYWSIRNNRDIVCRVPFLAFGYAKPKRLYVDGGKPRSDQHWKWNFMLKCIGNADDHYPELYVKGCAAINS